MIHDVRQQKLAHNLVDYSVSVKPNEKVLIEAYGCDYQFVSLLVEEVYKAGGIPFVELFDNKILKKILFNATEQGIKAMAKYALARMNEMDCYIGIRGGNNSFELSDVPQDKMRMWSNLYQYPVHHEVRVGKTKWVILRYPTEGMSQLASMSTEKFEDYYFKVCNLNYRIMRDATTPLVELMNRTDKVRIIAKDTDLSFSIKDIPSVKCVGERNIPDGEVYTAPVKDSVNGVITYNCPSMMDGFRFENVQLTFRDGKIVKARANNSARANAIFDKDEGARYVGEFAIGINPFVNTPIGDILFDEKIAGSIHFTPGCCYDEASNGNQSSVHWDLVLIGTPQYGGCEIYFDDVLIRKDGLFVIEELKGLNPDVLGKE